jgi:hypothetical protein
MNVGQDHRAVAGHGCGRAQDLRFELKRNRHTEAPFGGSRDRRRKSRRTKSGQRRPQNWQRSRGRTTAAACSFAKAAGSLANTSSGRAAGEP